MTREGKIKLVKIINKLQNEIEECNEIRMSPGGLSQFGEGKLEMAEDTLDMLLELI